MKKFIDICQFVLVLMGLMLCGLFLTSVIGLLPIGSPLSFSRQWLVFASQNIFAFIIPAILTWYMCFKTRPMQAIEANICPSWKMIGVALIIYILGMPLLNQTVFWNQEMHLPEFLSDFENWCRAMEDKAKEMTAGILNTTEIFPTVMNIIIIGILTGIGEEFFFRGSLQRMLVVCNVNPHTAIWTAAFVFSALHFQFFGFVPRLLLGAFFGYLYWWSGSIWVNAFSHALNNSLVIISNWCINKELISEDFDMLGVSSDAFPIMALLSALSVAATIYLLYKYRVIVNHQTAIPELPSNKAENATENI